MIQAQATLGSWPGLRHADALRAALDQVASGSLKAQNIQLCPQNHGLLTPERLVELQAMAPASKLRFHARVRIDDEHPAADASVPWDRAEGYFSRLAQLNKSLGNEPYTLHAGERAEATLDQMADNLRRISDTMGTRVGVEGLYPVAGNKYLLSTWSDYAWLLHSGLDFALDLSHVNIVAHRERRIERTLVSELLASEHLVELHLSHNDGHSDLHAKSEDFGEIWWESLLSYAHPTAVAFYEGNEVRGANAQASVTERVQTAFRRERSLFVH